MSSARFTRRCFLAGATLGTAVKAGDPQPIGKLVGGMAELVKLQRLPRVASNVAPSEFPQTDDVWQADFFHSPTFISHDDVGVERSWTAIVMDKRCRFVLSNELLRGEPTPEALWDHVVRSIAHPGPRAPMRPSAVEVSDSDCYDFLKPQLSRIGVECVMADELPELHDFCHLRQDVDEQPRCPSWCPGCPASQGQDLSLQSPVCHDI